VPSRLTILLGQTIRMDLAEDCGQRVTEKQRSRGADQTVTSEASAKSVSWSRKLPALVA
jgi:hypothetical protein